MPNRSTFLMSVPFIRISESLGSHIHIYGMAAVAAQGAAPIAFCLLSPRTLEAFRLLSQAEIVLYLIN